MSSLFNVQMENFDDLIAQMEALDIDALMKADPERIRALQSSGLLKDVAHGYSLAANAVFWGRVERGGQTSELPQVVRDHLTHVSEYTPVANGPFEGC